MVLETKTLLDRSTDKTLRDRLDELGESEDTTGFTHAELVDRVYQKLKERHEAGLGADPLEGSSSSVTPNAAITADLENFGRENRLSGATMQEIYGNGFKERSDLLDLREDDLEKRFFGLSGPRCHSNLHTATHHFTRFDFVATSCTSSESTTNSKISPHRATNPWRHADTS